MQVGHINAPRGQYPARDTRPAWEPKPYTEKQAAFITKLMEVKGITPEALRSVFPSRPSSAADASKVLDWLRGLPYAEKKASSPSKGAPNWDDIPDGNYAFEYQGKTHFYRVSRKAGKGKYTGRTFVNVQERASSVLYRVDDYKRRAAILRSIREKGPEACGLLFAERLGKCRFCFEDLTDEDNPYKVRGAGPVCGPKHLG